MTRSAAAWFALDRPWPPALRALAGGVAGWAAIRWGVTEAEPAWAGASAAGVAAAAGLAAPVVAREGAFVVSGWAAASALGLYLGVPETDHVVGASAVLAVMVLAAIANPHRTSWMVVVGLVVVLLWAAVRGAPGGGPALVAAMALPGLLVTAPLAAHLPGPRQGVVPRWARPAALVALQAVFALVVARNASGSGSDTVATAITVSALVVLTAAARLVAGSSSW